MNEETDEAKWSPDEGVGISYMCLQEHVYMGGGNNLLKIQFNTIYTMRGSRWFLYCFLEKNLQKFLYVQIVQVAPIH